MSATVKCATFFDRLHLTGTGAGTTGSGGLKAMNSISKPF